VLIAAIAILAAVGITVGLTSGGSGSATPQATVNAWLQRFNSGANANAAALWATPAAVRADFPAFSGTFTTPAQVQQWTAQQQCRLQLGAPIAVTSSVAVARVTATGPRPGAAGCSLTGTQYSYRFTVAGGRISGLHSTLTPAMTVTDWIALRNAGNDTLSAQLWASSATVHTADLPATVQLQSSSAIEQFWARRGCSWTQAGPVALQNGVVHVTLTRTGTRPGHNACTETGMKFQAAASLTGGRISKWIETPVA
jgi:hypothetical protein